MYDLLQTYDNDTLRDYIRQYSKIFKRVSLEAKKLSLRNRLLKSDNKIKTSWSIVKEITGKTHDNVSDAIELRLPDGNKTKNGETVANYFNTMYVNLPEQTVNSTNVDIEKSKKFVTLFLKDGQISNENKIFNLTNEEEILKIVGSLKSKTSTDYWHLSSKIVKSIRTELITPLTYIVNNALETGTFPDSLKLAKVIPLYKKGSSLDAQNYRPISLLPIFSKVVEKIMYIRLEKYLNYNNLFNPKQFGFRKSLSTIDAIAVLFKSILVHLELKMSTFGVFCDLSKAFDCVHHDILLAKLELYGVTGKDLSLCRSYLMTRRQVVNVNGACSKEEFTKCGVPQGSILGPLFFLLYINDISVSLNKDIEIFMFADDISLIIHCKNMTDSIEKINDALAKLEKWFICNNLLLNINKSNILHFSLNNRILGSLNSYNNLILRPVDNITFLGLKLDAKLTWKTHIDHLAKRLSSACYAIKKIKDFCGQAAAKSVYFAYFHSLMLYGILIWGNAANTKRIFILQKRAVRFVLGLKPRETCRRAFEQLNILTFTGAYILHCLLYVKKNISDFETLSADNIHGTRHGGRLRIQKFRLSKSSRSFLGNGVKLFNKLPDELKNSSNNLFKKKIKNLLIQKSYYSLGEALNDVNFIVTC